MTNNLLQKIKVTSQTDAIPILRNNTLDLIIKKIGEQKIRNILEIGTAYGYSAYKMSLCKSVHKVVTLEKNPNNWTIAKHFLNNVNKIELINTDAFLYTPHDIFDLILLDGPKSHQEELVKKYLDYLSPNGLIIVDNIYLKKITTKTNLNKNQQKLVVKLTNFKRWLIDNKTIQVEFIDVDDGVAFINKIS